MIVFDMRCHILILILISTSHHYKLIGWWMNEDIWCWVKLPIHHFLVDSLAIDVEWVYWWNYWVEEENLVRFAGFWEVILSFVLLLLELIFSFLSVFWRDNLFIKIALIFYIFVLVIVLLKYSLFILESFCHKLELIF